MEIDHFEHRRDIAFPNWFRNSAATRFLVTGEWSERLRHARALFVSFAGHDRRDRAAQRASFDAIVTVSITHDQRAKIGVAEAERPENVRVLCDLPDRITGVINHDFLRGNEN